MLRTVDSSLLAEATDGLRVSGLCKRYGATPVLTGIDLDVAKGELIAVLGPSGSGKTTLLRLLCGFEHADGGRITLGTRTVADGHKLHVPPEQRGVGYVSQDGALFPHLSVAENLLFGLPRRIRKARREAKTRHIGELLELVDLPASYAQRRPAALSGGEQQRVALARALAPHPAIVLLDEPFSALDAGLRAGLRTAVATTLQRAHATALLVTHDQDEALSMGDRVAVLQHGHFGQVATPQTLYRYPATREIAHFVGDAVLVPGTVTSGTVACCFGHLPIASESGSVADGAVDVMLRPEQFRLAKAPATDGVALLDARVDHLQFHGHDAKLTLRLREGPAFTATVPGFEMPVPGHDVNFRVTGTAVVYPRHG